MGKECQEKHSGVLIGSKVDNTKESSRCKKHYTVYYRFRKKERKKRKKEREIPVVGDLCGVASICNATLIKS